MWHWPQNRIDEQTLRFRVSTETRLLCWAEVIALWSDNPSFADAFCAVLADTPWSAFHWETPPLVEDGLDGPFEFVVADSPDLSPNADMAPFIDHFRYAGQRPAINFVNLGADAELIVPCPIASDETYAHLASFVRSAPTTQQRALWHEVGLAMERRVDERPLWLNTAGGGVAWLHVRLDDAPKYYMHAPYRSSPPESWAGAH